MMNPTRRDRRAVTLIEALLMSSLALLVVGAAWMVMRRSMMMSDQTSQQVGLQVGVRNLIENLVHDASLTQQVMDPTGVDARSNLDLLRPASDDVGALLTRNPSRAFPFQETTSLTVQTMDAVKISYRYNTAKREVVRTEEAGQFQAVAETATPGRLTKFQFVPARVVNRATLASSVETFAFTYVAYDVATGEPQVCGRGLPVGFEKTACLGLRLTAVFDEGLYKNDATTPRIDMATKIWIAKRRSDETYKEYFSSTDEDVRW